jgi:DMSO reductase anchor subunit
VFNPQRRVVTKCDLCEPRLAGGAKPACVEACPTRAITVEKVNVAQWRLDHHQADAPGLPPSSITISTTRIVLPDSMPVRTRAVVDDQAAPADPHWPLIAVTLLTQLSLGALAATVGEGTRSVGGAAVAAAAGAVALVVSTLHLGRPAAAWKALRNLRRSWLSREVALFTAFSAVTFAYAAALLATPTAALGVGAVATAIGIAGVYASGRLYLVPARPVWNSPRTVVAFFATVVATGPLVAVLCTTPTREAVRVLFAVAALGSLIQLGVIQHLVASIAARKEREYSLTARLLFGPLRLLFWLRAAAALAAVALCACAALSETSARAPAWAVAALVVAAGGELAGRYLFFVSVTPMTAARRFSAGSR